MSLQLYRSAILDRLRNPVDDAAQLTEEIRTSESGYATDYPLTLLMLFFLRKPNSEAWAE
ncbi:MAG TPA: hypothetical protein DHU55_13070 [Blastocatellia bacterium]|jgi:hypothetical protein|nr:hypothetical protein [Blastocatellia bacterium]HAF25523.1 hypothetical protein [Blastocatellia bacterium]HCX30678.1 hypothetical protein [Blastocatellia bacterium]